MIVGILFCVTKVLNSNLSYDVNTIQLHLIFFSTLQELAKIKNKYNESK